MPAPRASSIVRVGVDIGGTFTDLVLRLPDGSLRVSKIPTGAWGARPDKDGMEAVTNPSQNMSNSPVEVLEAHHPIRVDEYGFVPDSCAARALRATPT